MITNAILPQTTGAASFKRVLGSLNNVPRTAYIAWGRCGVVRQKDVVQVRDGVGPEGQQKARRTDRSAKRSLGNHHRNRKRCPEGHAAIAGRSPLNGLGIEAGGP